MVIGETKTQKEKLDEASNRPRGTNEASKMMDPTQKERKRKRYKRKDLTKTA